MRKNILINIILLTVMAASTVAFIGFVIRNKRFHNIKDAPAIEINAVDLYRALSGDSIKAKFLFVNKLLAVTGEVKQIKKNLGEVQVILLQTNIPNTSINCNMEQNNCKIKTGDTIEIKGICTGYISRDAETQLHGDVFLKRCYKTF